jgi:Phage integrase, N-terminal SAM-like domain
MVRSGATFADAAAEWLRLIEEDRARKPSTVRDYQSMLEGRLLTMFGSMPIQDITPAVIERWRLSLGGLRTVKQAADRAARDLPPGAKRLWPGCESARPDREASTAIERRHRGVFAGGGVGAGACGCLGAGCRSDSHGGVHRPPDHTQDALAPCHSLIDANLLGEDCRNHEDPTASAMARSLWNESGLKFKVNVGRGLRLPFGSWSLTRSTWCLRMPGDGLVYAHVPELPEVHTQGETLDQAREMCATRSGSSSRSGAHAVRRCRTTGWAIVEPVEIAA